MDSKLLIQIQNYTPPLVLQEALKNSQVCFQLAKYTLDREFRSRPQRWRSLAFPEYEDFFQAALSGFNPYKETNGLKDKGLLQAIQTYNPYKKLKETNQLIIENINGIDQALCFHCNLRGEKTSLWPHSAGNSLSPELAPESLFYKGNKYCGKQIDSSDPKLIEWLEKGLVHQIDGKYYCNFKNRLTSLRSYISSQVNFLIQDVRSAEYHNSRTLRRYPFYSCKDCGTLNPDWDYYTSERKETLSCLSCKSTIETKNFQGKKGLEVVWQARGGHTLSLDQSTNEEEDGKNIFENIVSNVPFSPFSSDQAVLHGTLDVERAVLMERLIQRIKELSLESIPEKQRLKFISENGHLVEDGIPETQNFKIFYNYFFMDDQDKKKEHNGKSKNRSDESSTYRQLALKFLKKEQHYTRCLDCGYKMYEPTESGKFKKAGPHKVCSECNSTKVKYHGPKCGRPNSLDPSCQEHGNIEIVMYIFQTVEPKIRRLEEIVRSDREASELYRRIKELIIARDEMDSFVDMIKLLNF